MKIVYKAQLGDNAPVQIVGHYEIEDAEWENELSYYDGNKEEWLQNTGSDWAYEAVHSDCLRYWAEEDNG